MLSVLKHVPPSFVGVNPSSLLDEWGLKAILAERMDDFAERKHKSLAVILMLNFDVFVANVDYCL